MFYHKNISPLNHLKWDASHFIDSFLLELFHNCIISLNARQYGNILQLKLPSPTYQRENSG
jgi:hypothetical protein